MFVIKVLHAGKREREKEREREREGQTDRQTDRLKAWFLFMKENVKFRKNNFFFVFPT